MLRPGPLGAGARLCTRLIVSSHVVACVACVRKLQTTSMLDALSKSPHRGRLRVYSHACSCVGRIDGKQSLSRILWSVDLSDTWKNVVVLLMVVHPWGPTIDGTVFW